MGQRGSDVSREVADLVLLDDNFSTIVGAVEEGRGIYENIQKFLRFLFSTNLSEVLLIAAGAVLAFAIDLRDAAGTLMLPLTAVQILWINLLTDGIPALALAFDRTPGVMQQPPRPAHAPLLDRPSVRFVVAVGSMKAALALGVLGVLPLFGYSLDVTRAAAFHFMAVGQLCLVYPSRHTWMQPLPNAYLLAAVIAGVAIQFAAASLPITSRLLGNAAIPVELWGVVFGGAALAWGLAEACARLVWASGVRVRGNFDGGLAQPVEQSRLAPNRPPVIQKNLERTPHRHPPADEQALPDYAAGVVALHQGFDEVANDHRSGHHRETDRETDAADAEQLP